ncbi:MAG TPA: PspC domain-containing protein [Microthrixaceae bacterium]|nr:PspC domain-containing protein [Microthrixaceae bacterium]
MDDPIAPEPPAGNEPHAGNAAPGQSAGPPASGPPPVGPTPDAVPGDATGASSAAAAAAAAAAPAAAMSDGPVSGQSGGERSAWDRLVDLARSLRRSSEHNVLGGVCGGIADRWALPGWIVRCVAILLAFMGIGVPLYVVLWVLVPRDDGQRALGHGPVRDVLAIGVLALAGMVLLDRLQPGYDSPADGSRFLAWALVLGGAALVLRRPGGQRAGGPASATTAAPSAAPPVPFAAIPLTPPRARPFLTPLTLAIAAVAGGVAAIVAGVGDGPVNIGVPAGLVLAILGVGLTVSAHIGRARGLVVAAAPIAGVLALILLGDVRLAGEVRPAALKVVDGNDLPSNVDVLAGTKLVDLGDLELDRDATLHLRTSLGTARVVLPRSVRTAVVADTGLGRVDLARPILADVGHLMSPAAALAFLAHPDPARSLRGGEVVHLDDVRRVTGDSSIHSLWQLSQQVESPDGASVRRTFGPKGGPVLHLEIAAGSGSVVLVEPRWAGELDVTTPAALCMPIGSAGSTVEWSAVVPCDTTGATPVRACEQANYSGSVIACSEAGDEAYVLCRRLSADPVRCSDLEAELRVIAEQSAPPAAAVPPTTDPAVPAPGPGTADPSAPPPTSAAPSTVAVPTVPAASTTPTAPEPAP